MINIFNKDVVVLSEGESYIFDGKEFELDVLIFECLYGFDCFDVCKVIVSEFEEFGLLEKIEDYSLIVFYGDCFGVVIELFFID